MEHIDEMKMNKFHKVTLTIVPLVSCDVICKLPLCIKILFFTMLSPSPNPSIFLFLELSTL